ncbi:Asp/Glu/hydantoin racemase [Mesorhizobium sp. L-8-10]|uniref:aspartate/glutamate racemase family protein n=1 Tax=unclassified Mesorhizobium TaxID=325217 RepID=UPI00192527BF|nr:MULTISPECIES: aspartate/glutamate racemase family protein [unclassified Mesorhizobium]BCH26630.1 Asp/Glu/hydantoin racemase [Mesorhizobium sp. L-8-3]BCH34613.1 Asp/Glu/hydantoin racemase [Mesorhizobium sp. L-8-10]
MRLLLLNPNTSEGVTELIDRAGRAAAASQTEVTSITAPRGVPYIATRAEAVIGGAVALEMLAERHQDYDAAVIAAFGDPGLGGARELFPLPVIGLAEAGMLTACMLGRRFSIVTFAQALAPWYEECVEWHGLRGRCGGISTLDGKFAAIDSVQEEKQDLLAQLAHEAIAKHDTDVIVLAGAPLAGLADKIADRVPVPVIDCVAAAVKQAEALAALSPRKATVGTFRRPQAKPTMGLPSALGAWISQL